MSYKGQVLRGEKWYHLMTEEQLAKEPENSSKHEDIKVYLASKEKVKEELKSKEKK